MGESSIFCFPFAGASSNVYLKWKKYYDPDIQIFPVELPGRGKRLREKLLYTMDDVVASIVESIKPCLHDKPYFFFGHSMGGVLAYEVAKCLYQIQLPGPKALFITGRNSPDTKPKKFRHDLSFDELKTELLELGGTPENLLNDDVLLQLFIPVIRADFQVVETYCCEAPSPIESDIYVISGEDDIMTKDSDLGKWRNFTSGAFETIDLKGDHFFIFQEEETLAGLIRKRIHYNYLSNGKG